jgi:hypothetical protein
MGPMEVVGVMLLLMFFAVLFVLPAVIGYRLGLARGHEVMGLVLGILFSWIGVLIVALLPKTQPARA